MLTPQSSETLVFNQYNSPENQTFYLPAAKTPKFVGRKPKFKLRGFIWLTCNMQEQTTALKFEL
jgi:hypothetical protein